MVRVRTFEKFCSIISDFKTSGIQVKIFGNKKEDCTGWFDDPLKTNRIQIRLLAMTSIGTIYCHERIIFDDPESIKQTVALINSLEITSADIAFNDENGTISIK